MSSGSAKEYLVPSTSYIQVTVVIMSYKVYDYKRHQAVPRTTQWRRAREKRLSDEVALQRANSMALTENIIGVSPTNDVIVECPFTAPTEQHIYSMANLGPSSASKDVLSLMPEQQVITNSNSQGGVVNEFALGESREDISFQSSGEEVLLQESGVECLSDATVSESSLDLSLDSSPSLDNGFVGDDHASESVFLPEPTQTSLPSKLHINNHSGSETLCPCTKVTAADINFMCLVLGMRHNLTWEAQVDILSMIDVIYGSNGKINNSKYRYLKEVAKEKEVIKYHIFCPDCECIISQNNENLSGEEVCLYCKKKIVFSNPANFFISIPIEHQLQKLLLDPNVASSIINHRFNREKSRADALEDIYDGEEYQKHVRDNGVLSSEYNFSFSFFADGVSPGNSTGKTLWPLYLVLNELPHAERSKNLLLGCLYIGSKDPNLAVFCAPFVEEINKLSISGFTWVYNGSKMTSKVIPLCCISDSVARCKLMNMQAYGAYWGCTFCYHKSEHTRRGSRFVLTRQRAQERTDLSMRDDLRMSFMRQNEAKAEDRHYRGVKGPSPLLELNYFSFFKGNVIDYLHCFLLGAMKTQIDLLLDSSRRKWWNVAERPGDSEKMGLKHLTDVIDQKLLNIKPPSGISRTPRSINKNKLWKGNEWRNFLLFYAIPCLKGLLKDKYLLHIAMLSKATNILLQKSVTNDEVKEADRLLSAYVFFFQEYFNEENMVYNIHLLLHVSKGVLNWGPLWTHNAFMYEGQNRFLLQLLSSPKHVLVQIAKRFLIYTSLPQICEETVTSTDAIIFCENILERRFLCFVRGKDGILLGKGKSFTPSPLEIDIIQDCDREVSVYSPCLSYNRLICKGMRLSTAQYSQSKEKNDSFVFLKNGMSIKIQKILLFHNKTILILGLRIIPKRGPVLKNTYVNVQHIKEVQDFGELLCVGLDEIDSQCIFMEIERDYSFYCKMPYGCRGD